MDCQTCGKSLEGRQRTFCSNSCKNVVNGRRAGGHNKQQRIPKVCAVCGAPFEVLPAREHTAKFCSRSCTAKYAASIRDNTGANNPRWKGGIQTYRRFKKAACERCGSDRFLIVHHRDEDRYNNELANLETLCKRCHQLHHDCAKNLPQNRRTAR